jgi:hypothetical protein
VLALTWNIYYGAIGANRPVDRLRNIAAFCLNNGVDLACLQEVPAGDLNLGGFQGALAPPPNAGNAYMALASIPNFFPSYGTWAVRDELAPQQPGWPARVTNRSTGGYLFLYLRASLAITNVNGGGWYMPQSFRQPQTTFLFRPPFELPFTEVPTGTALRVLNQHAEASANDAQASVICFDQAVGAPNAPTVICADLNVSDVNHVATQPLFGNFNDIVALYHVNVGQLQQQGVDHILVNNANATAPPAINALLNFTSDAYHFPIVAQW